MRVFWLLQTVAILLAPPAVYAWRHRGDAEWAIKGSAFALAGVSVAFFGLFAIGEALADPGGWAAVGATAAWLVPMAGLAVLAWRRPRQAAAALGVALAGLAGAYVWSAAAPDAWAAFEDTNGPVRALVAFALAGPLAVLGWRRPRVAGLMLVALPLLPLTLVLVNVLGGAGLDGWPIAMVTAPSALVGLLYLVASRPSGAGRHPDHPERMGGGRRQPVVHDARIDLGV